jgi:hypothetical protein
MLRTLFNNIKKYRIGKLKPVLYLFDKDSTIIEYNKNVAYSIVGDCYELACASVSYSCTSSDTGRYQFESTITANLDERDDNYALVKKLLSHGWLVGFVTQEGDKFLVSPEFASQVTYEFAINDSEKTNTTTITFKTITNIPNITVVPDFQVTSTLRGEDCRYYIGEVTKLELCKADSTTVGISNDTLIVKGDSSQVVTYNQNTLTFTESYDGDNFEQTLTFDVPFSSDAHDFHYSLLEYAENEYYAILTTKQGNVVLGGYEYGMLPTYQIQSSEDASQNKVTMTLKYYSSSHGVLVKENIKYLETENIKYETVEWECVNGVYSCVVLLATNNGTEEYLALEGYEDAYSELYPISGTYDNVYSTDYGVKLFDDNILCILPQCVTSFPTKVEFTATGQTVTVNYSSNCNIMVDDNDFADVTIGSSTISITNKSEESYVLQFYDVNGYGYLLDCEVTIPKTIYTQRTITAQATSFTHTLTYPMSDVVEVIKPLQIRIMPALGGEGLVISVPENEAEFQVQYLVTIRYANGDVEILTITQNQIYVRYVDDNTQMCVGNDLYKFLLKYKGYRFDKVDIQVGYVQDELIAKNSLLCMRVEIDGGLTPIEPIEPIE